MLREQDIILELKYYQKFHKTYLEGKREDDLPLLPKNRDDQNRPCLAVLGILIHTLLAICMGIVKLLHLHKFAAFFSRIRIATDKYSYEPVSCGYNKAYTNLGLALLAQGDIGGAIKCLDASWRVHPCPHNSSFGLSRRLVSQLKHYPDASEVVSEYVRIGKKFISWSEKWARNI